MTIWRPVLERIKPLYVEILEALERDIASGTLPAGTRLPPQRELAWALGITLGTVTRAYREATVRGLVEAHVGRGTCVKAPVRPVSEMRAATNRPDAIIDLSVAVAATQFCVPHMQGALAHILAHTDRDLLLGHAPYAGYETHRAMGAQWLARLGVTVPPEQIIVTTGAQPGVVAALAALAQNGDSMCVESLVYPSIKGLARLFGLNLVPVEGDADGMVPEALERAIHKTGARLLYVVPGFQNGTCASLDGVRRLAMAQIAQRHGLTIIEDDIFRPLTPRALAPSLYSLAPERTIHVSSISKALSAGLRVGFIAAPPELVPRLTDQMSNLRATVNCLSAEILRVWIESGVAETIIAGAIAENDFRRLMVQDALGASAVSSQEGIGIAWLSLPGGWSSSDFAHAALARGVRVTPDSVFSVHPSPTGRQVRLALGGPLSRAQIQDGLDKLAAVMKERPDLSFGFVA